MFLRSPGPACCFLLTVTLAGCVAPGMGGVSVNVPTAGGATTRVEFDSKGVVHASNRDVAIEGVTLLPDGKAKTVRYGMSFRAERPLQLRRVTVEDISDDVPATLLVDEHPVIDAQHRWKRLAPPFAPDENNLRFLFQLENSVRIYRFTIETADGRTIILEDGANFPAMAKRYFRFTFGFEKIDKR